MRAAIISFSVLAIFSLSAGCTRPRLTRYEQYFRNEKAPPPSGWELRAIYFGTSTIFLTDGETNLMIDGFFTRPSGVRENTPFSRIAPSPAIIAKTLRRAGITKLDAVLVAHSHYDHALDSPEVAKQTGAVLVGSRSTLMVARGWAFPLDRFILVDYQGTELTFGQFKVNMIHTNHGPTTAFGADETPTDETEINEIEEPVIPPQRLMAYLEGGSYAFHFEHPLGNVLVQPSAGIIRGQFDRFQADVAFIGIARLGGVPRSYREAYFRETVGSTGATRVFPIHWDDYTSPLEEPLRPIKNMMDDFHDSMRFLIERVEATPGVQMRMLQGYEEVVLYRGDEADRPPPSSAPPAQATSGEVDVSTTNVEEADPPQTPAAATGSADETDAAPTGEPDGAEVDESGRDE